MVSAELLWQCVRKTSCYIKKSNGVVLTSEPLNLTQKNTLRHSGLCHKLPVGISLVGNSEAVRVSHKLKGGRKFRYPRRCVTSKKFAKTHSKTKELQQLVAQQRPDLVKIAKKRFHKMCRVSPKASQQQGQ
ncbi:60S ribosomal protein L28, putative [Eimeria acervulina]|uniref:60S ribosomal protein L28, putative n=1 Tax=Eimeria acervulina TaxID=5801 RepID=U6GQ88_EIMAC|nr:60S ribosomal protein L28, putative [Eimeria acervulina]CDI81732.1 60S ribosomal protein L28, putative [Eimeria acervulina]